MSASLQRTGAQTLETKIISGYAPKKTLGFTIITFLAGGQPALKFTWHPGFSPAYIPSWMIVTVSGHKYYRNAYKVTPAPWIPSGGTVNELRTYAAFISSHPTYYGAYPGIYSAASVWWEFLPQSVS